MMTVYIYPSHHRTFVKNSQHFGRLFCLRHEVETFIKLTPLCALDGAITGQQERL